MLSFLGLALGLLCHCGKSEAGKETAAAPPTTTKSEESQWKTWLRQGTDPEWLKAQWNKGIEQSTRAKEALAAIKMPELGAQMAKLKEAIEKQDISKIKELAKSVDETLATKNMEDALGFIVLHRQKGGDAAIQAIDEYASRKDLNDYERAAASSLKQSMAFIQRDDVRGWLFYSIMFTCECKFGSHEGAAIGCLINTVLFPDIVFKKDAPSSSSPASPKP